MAHFAEVENGIVKRVIVADTKEWCETNLGGTWVQTSYNTAAGVNKREGGIALHKNYAGVGHIFDGVGFHAPQPFASWTLNQDSYLWEAPTSMPEDGKIYEWSEEDLAWVEVAS
jgi:hypothetical protein